MLLLRILKFGIKTKNLKQNQFDFLDLIRAPTGLHVKITAEEKQKINKQIDKKMQQLQDTGLSREQILLSKSQKGIPLAIDPFFQFLKKNKTAREVYLRKNDRFTVQKVIDIALRQDIGPDTSYSRTRSNDIINQKGRAQLMNDLQQRERTSFDPSSYNANKETNVKKLYDQLKPNQPLRHIYRPIFRYQRIKTHQKRLKKYDIHWRNIQLLRQFITPYGNIKSRLVNRLSKGDQRRVQMAIKTARHNCAIPFYGRILKPNRKNITNLQQEVKQIGLQNVNLQTGQIYYSRSRSMDSVQVEKQAKDDTDWRYQQMISGKTYQLWIQTPDKQDNQQLISSQRYARHLKNKQNQASSFGKDPVSLRKLALKKITGLGGDQQPEIGADQSPEAQKSYQKRKIEVTKKLKENPLSFSQIILQQKTMM